MEVSADCSLHGVAADAAGAIAPAPRTTSGGVTNEQSLRPNV